MPDTPEFQPTKRLNMQPVGDGILVHLEVPAKDDRGLCRNEAGIILTDATILDDMPRHGCVVGVGRGRDPRTGERYELDVQVGDRVVCVASTGQRYGYPFRDPVTDEYYRLVKEKDILTIYHRSGAGAVLLVTGDRVLVESEMQDSELEMTFGMRRVEPEATVVAVGPGARLVNGERASPDVRVGDRVLLADYIAEDEKHGGHTTKAVGKPCKTPDGRLLRNVGEDDIVGTI